jgi:NAD-dependent SIR2 family protein deacetylase
MSTDHLTHNQETKTVLDCHQCHKQFVALLDFTVNGNHVIECAHCGHEHCRVIDSGVITGERWDSRHGDDRSRDALRPRRVWKADALPATTSSAAEFMRQRWLDRALR